MKVDEFGLGAWWPRPEQAAAGALDHLPPDQWPMLAAKWRAAGFDSEPLRRLAGLRSWKDGGPGNFATRLTAGATAGEHVFDAEFDAMDLMPEVLRSIGFDPAPVDEEFAARCQDAVDVVQHDLDVTGYGRYRMRARLGRGWPARLFPTLPDGSYWGGGEGMSRPMHGAGLLCAAAESVSDTLKEVHEIAWPVCAAHGRDPTTSIWDDEPVALIDEMPWWWCTRAGHALAPVGQLTAKIARTL